MGDRRGSNPRQLAPQASALPTELRPPVMVIIAKRRDKVLFNGHFPNGIRCRVYPASEDRFRR